MAGDSPIDIQIAEIENQIKHLVRSNVELQEALKEEPDPELRDAVGENIVAIARRRAIVEDLRRQRTGLLEAEDAVGAGASAALAKLAAEQADQPQPAAAAAAAAAAAPASFSAAEAPAPSADASMADADAPPGVFL
jgi:hypothetical protein